jgi:hypothetical protein
VGRRDRRNPVLELRENTLTRFIEGDFLSLLKYQTHSTIVAFEKDGLGTLRVNCQLLRLLL